MNNWILAVSTFGVIVFSSVFIHYLEPKEFPTVFVGLWWTLTTMSTVGYGDYSPQTIDGRIFAMLLYVFGIGLLGVVIGKVLEFFTIMRKQREAGLLDFKGTGHIIIIGWSPKSALAVRDIFSKHPKAHIVLVDQLEMTPIERDHVVYVKGQPALDETLLRANIKDAKAVLIFADESIHDSTLADGKTLLITTSVERLNREAHSTAEIMDRAHLANFKSVNVDSFIVSHETISSMAVAQLQL